MAPARATARQLRPPPTGAQRRAADPACSVWVKASAGTGKTRVLSDRVLRLLLAGTDPLRVLCLTFTKAAAAEMTTRIQKDLARFATWPERELRGELERLLGRAPDEAELHRARGLLPRVLDLPAGLPVMTIHGFCQSLLRRFPLEAGVPPHFGVIEPRDANDLLRQAQDDVLANPRGEVVPALRRVAVVLGEANLREGLAALREDRLDLSALLERDGDVEAVIERLRGTLGVAPGITLERWAEGLCRDPAIDVPGLREACRALGRGADGLRASAIANWLECDLEQRIATFEDYRGAFWTRTSGPLKQFLAKAAAAVAPAAEEALQHEQQRLVDALEQRKRIVVLERTAAILRVGAAVIGCYDERKAREAVLDFDDLIAYSRRLLARPGISSWVNYKLDQQIDHLLVDEGQDTSPEQWAIIEALCDEFFAGEGARERRRTLFVVGDEKQSIFSFQGADLETFQRLHERFGERARAARAGWREEPLNRSFRSARPILEVVDAVFAGERARDGVIAGHSPLRHETARGDAAGSVEVWPLVEVQPQPKPDSWQLPDRPDAVDRPEDRLAQLITNRILEWRRSEVPLASTGKPLQPGDLMILLPRRGILQDLLIRQLKRNQIQVAGADRLALLDEIAVMDLMALGHALLLPEDDLTLAAVLRSPLFGLGEDHLFELAHDRGEASLYERLRARDGERPVFAEASRRFRELLRQADHLPPFELYCRLLGEGGGRRRFLARLGPSALDPIEAFLAQALAYERAHAPSLQGFLHWLGADTTDLVRDPDRPRDEVRVVTVHGAKGLEAPVVFVADATFVPSQQDRLLWLEPEGLPVWRVAKDLRDPVSERADRRARERDLQEQRRLLYVAMTRAQDHLIVAGWKRNRQSEPTWYDLIEAARRHLPGVEPCRVPGLEGEGWRYANRPQNVPAQQRLELRSSTRGAAAPPWLWRQAPEDAAAGAPLTPSGAFGDEEPPARSPLGDEAARFQRGRVVHKLLQSLPERPAAERDDAMARYLAQAGLALAEAAQAEIAAEVRGLLAIPELQRLFGPGSRAEVPLAGTVGGVPIAGQVDRLVVTEEEVLVVDYKTNRSPPASADEIPVIYWRQMAAYRALLREIWPDRPVRCALVWTDGPSFMPLDDAEIARHLPGRGG